MTNTINYETLGRLTQAEGLPALIKPEWYEQVNRKTSALTIEFTREDIFNEVNKRTSYLGKYRNAEGLQHLLDIIEMTDDDDELFESFILNISAEVFECFSKYTGNDESEFVCDADGVKFGMLYPSNANMSMLTPLEIAVKDALAMGVIYQWLMFAYPAEVQNYVALYQGAVSNVRKYSNALLQPSSTYVIPRPY